MNDTVAKIDSTVSVYTKTENFHKKCKRKNVPKNDKKRKGTNPSSRLENGTNSVNNESNLEGNQNPSISVPNTNQSIDESANIKSVFCYLI